MPASRRNPPKPKATTKPSAKKTAAKAAAATAKKTPPKKTPPKKTPPKKTPPKPGFLDQALVANLRNAPKGTPPEAVVMETLRSVPAEQLKAELAKAPAKERNLAF